jgi:Ca2+-transporting ATPase
VIGFEQKEDGIMEEKPRSVKAPVLTHLALSLIGVISITSSIFALFLFGHFFQAHNNPVEGRSIVFASFAINSMIYIFAYRSMRKPLWRMNKLTTNKPLIWAVLAGLLTALVAFWIPGLRNLLGIVPLSLEEWLWVSGVALALLVAVEFGKAVSNQLHAND